MRLAASVAAAAAVAVAVAWPAGPALADTPPVCSQSASTVTCTYGYTGDSQSFTVLAGVQSIAVDVLGAQGGTGAGPDFSPRAVGGEGARVQATLPVTPGETLAVLVGGAGTSGCQPGSFNGGGVRNACGDTAGIGAGGGGASDLRIAPFGLAQRIVVAGGGGGGGGNGEGTGPGGAGGPEGGRGGDGGATGMAGSDQSAGVLGGQPGAGATDQGGAGGIAGTPNGNPGQDGSLGQGGSQGEGAGNGGGDGGGGGGGYFGGGGGAGGGGSTVGGGSELGAGGGGGGGGSSFVEPLATSESITGGAQTGNGVIEISYGVPEAASVPVSFPTQPQGTISGVQTVFVANRGNAPLMISGMTFSGADPQDFVIGFNGCLGPLPAGASCTIGVNFIPQAVGARTADLNIASNDPNSPLTVVLSGTGAAPSTPGVPPFTGGTPAPKVHRILLMSCHSAPASDARHRTRATRLRCSSRALVSQTKLRVTKHDIRATITRGHRRVASGYAVRTGPGHWQLVVQAKHKLRHGRYRLALRSRHKGRSITRHETLILG
jgi:hypothetical protein